MEHLESQVFSAAAVDHGLATIAGDYKSANKAYRRMKQSFWRMKQRHNCLLQFEEMLSDSNPWVQSWAAVALLGEGDERGLKVLRQLSEDSGVVGFGAKETLNLWETGGFKQPFP